MKNNIDDVAKKAGVSTATVSRIVNNKTGYSESTKRKVLQVIDELGYKPNAMARGLVRQKTNTIGILMPCLSSRFSFELLKGIEKVAHSKNYSVIICNTDRNGEQTLTYLQTLSEKRVDGIIFISEWLKDEYGEFLEKLNIPVALVATYTDKFPFPYVRVDDRRAAYSAVSYLIRRGHKKIGMISGNPDDRIAGEPRIAGYRQALVDHGLPVQEEYISYGDFHFQSGISAMQDLYEKNLGITAVFAASDEMAAGAVAYLHSKKIPLPEGMSIMGYDDTLDAEMTFPALTTVRQPIEKMGEWAMELLQNKDHKESIILQHSIAERDSVVDA